eukprot:COSAG02_NODE_12120_length_1592_cov_19.594776_1_plen_110_part_00
MRQGHTVREAVKLNNRLVQDDEAGGSENTAETKLGHVARCGSVHRETQLPGCNYSTGVLVRIRLPLHAGRPEAGLERRLRILADRWCDRTEFSRNLPDSDSVHSGSSAG